MRSVFRRLTIVAVFVVAFAVLAYYSGFDFGSSSPSQSSAADTPPLPLVHINREFTAPDCDRACATIVVRSLKIARSPDLSQAIEQRLVQLGFRSNGPLELATIQGASIGAYARSFFQAVRSAAQTADPDARVTYRERLSTRAISYHERLITLRLESTLSRNGAPLSAQDAYAMIDAIDKKIVSLPEMLRAGQNNAFNAAVKRAFNEWQNTHANATGHAFEPSDNVALLEDGVLIGYPPGTLKPAALGASELHLSYDQLDGILKPRFMPGGGDASS